MQYVMLIDDMAYTRGSKDDFDRWANVTGDDGWSWNSLFSLMEKVCLAFRIIQLSVLTEIFRWRG